MVRALLQPAPLVAVFVIGSIAASVSRAAIEVKEKLNDGTVVEFTMNRSPVPTHLFNVELQTYASWHASNVPFRIYGFRQHGALKLFARPEGGALSEAAFSALINQFNYPQAGPDGVPIFEYEGEQIPDAEAQALLTGRIVPGRVVIDEDFRLYKVKAGFFANDLSGQEGSEHWISPTTEFRISWKVHVSFELLGDFVFTTPASIEIDAWQRLKASPSWTEMPRDSAPPTRCSNELQQASE